MIVPVRTASTTVKTGLLATVAPASGETGTGAASDGLVVVVEVVVVVVVGVVGVVGVDELLEHAASVADSRTIDQIAERVDG